MNGLAVAFEKAGIDLTLDKYGKISAKYSGSALCESDMSFTIHITITVKAKYKI
ncbi:MAG: hypothetical protein ABFR05_01560 [Bacteroidota bacterium]